MADDEGIGPGGIFVLAGPNGAGKSSVGGEAFRETGNEYFNPDEYAQRLAAELPGLTAAQANSHAWEKGRDLLIEAIEEGKPYAFETTLGGSTIPDLLREAAMRGRRVSVWYVALESADLHVERVARRVAQGGHPIPEEDIRRRYDSSRVNIADLLPLLHEVKVFDNSMASAGAPAPLPVVHVVEGAIVGGLPLEQVPAWAKPIVAAALAAAHLSEGGAAADPD